jgi:hypothetical protein
MEMYTEYREFGQALALVVGFTDNREDALDFGVLAPLYFSQSPFVFTKSVTDGLEKVRPDGGSPGQNAVAWAKITLPGNKVQNVYIDNFNSSEYPSYAANYDTTYYTAFIGSKTYGIDYDFTIYDEDFNIVSTGNAAPMGDDRIQPSFVRMYATLSPGKTYWIRIDDWHASGGWRIHGEFQQYFPSGNAFVYFYNYNNDDYLRHTVSIYLGDPAQFAQARVLIDSPVKIATGNTRTWITRPDAQAYAMTYVVKPYKFAATQTLIINGYKYAQARVFIRVQGNYAQANARITDTYAIRYAQARVRIAYTGGFANAQTWIETEYYQPAQSATLIVFGGALAQAQASINQSSYVAQAQAYLYSFDQPVHGQALTSTKVETYAWAQAMVWIKLRAYGGALLDTFDRTSTDHLSFNLGMANTGQIWQYAGGYWQEWRAHVYPDSGNLVVENPGTYSYNYVYAKTSPSLPSIKESGTVEFDIYIPAQRYSGYTGYHYMYWYDIDWYFYLYDYSDTTYRMRVNSTSVYLEVTPERETWYSVKVSFDVTGEGSSTYAKAKMWKRGTTEPESWTRILSVYPYTSYYDEPQLYISTPYIRKYDGIYDNPLGLLDNLKITTHFDQYFNQGYANATADILAISDHPAQAQASINQSSYVAQTRVWVKQTYNIYSQAQAWIKKGWGFGLAGAKIKWVPDIYASKVIEDGATHLYGIHIKPYPTEYYWQDEIGNANSIYYYWTYLNTVTSPVRPEKIGAFMNYYREYRRWYDNIVEEFWGDRSWTIETWVKSPQTASYRSTIFDLRAGNSPYYYVTVYFGSNTGGNGNKIVTYFNNPVDVTEYADTGIVYTPNTWYHVVLTYSNKEFKLYVNSELKTTTQRPNWNFNTSSAIFSIHYSGWFGYNSGTSEGLSYDNLAIYPLILTPEQIYDHYLYGVAPTGQALASINQSSYVAQAQARILRTYPNADGPGPFAQAGFLYRTGLCLAQAIVYISPAFDQNVFGQAQARIVGVQFYGQAQAIIHARDGIAARVFDGNANNINDVDILRLWEYYNEIGPLEPQYTYSPLKIPPTGFPTTLGGTISENWGIVWVANFVADEAGVWYFSSVHDDWTYVGIKNWSTGTTTTVINNTGTGTHTGSINLTEGQQYTLVCGFSNGGGPWYIGLKYGRPGKGSAVDYLTDDNPPWIPASSRYKKAQANAWIVYIDPNSGATVWPTFSQANARIQYSNLQAYGQATVQFGTWRPAQAIAQIAYSVTDNYRGVVLADKPIFYFPLDDMSASYSASTYYSAAYLPDLAADGNTNDGWASLGYSAGNTWWQVNWREPQTIQTVTVTNRPNYTMGSGRILFSDGSSFSVTFPSAARGVSNYSTPVTNVTWMRLISDSGGNTNPGFSEVEAFNGDTRNLVRWPIISGIEIEPTKLKTIVGRRDATWSSTINPTGTLNTAVGFGGAVDFNNMDAVVPAINSGTTGETLTFPGTWKTESSSFKLSTQFWLNAGDTVTIDLTNVYCSGYNISLGLWKTNDGSTSENTYAYIGSGPITGTFTRTATQTGIHYIYIYTSGGQSYPPTGSGTISYPNYNIESSLPITDGSPITVEFWLNYDGQDQKMVLGFTHYDIFLRNTGAIGFNDGAGNHWGTLGISANNWHHVAAVMYTGQAANVANKIYIDGVQKTLSWISGTGINVRYFSERFVLGGWNSNTSYRATFPIDELAIFNYELTAEQILNHYQARKNQGYAIAQARIIAFDVPQVAQAQAQFGTWRPAQALAKINAFDWPQQGQAQTLISTRYGLTRMTWTSLSSNEPERWGVGNIYRYDIEGIRGYPNYSEYGENPTSWIRDDDWGMAWSVRFTADATGTWQFQTISDDGSEVRIDGAIVVNNNFGGGQGSTTRSGSITLTQGQEYNLHARWGQGGGPWNITIQYKRPTDLSWQYLTSNNPPWILEYFYAGFGQAQVYTQKGIRYEGVGQAQARLIAFGVEGVGQALTTILRPYRVYAQALVQLTTSYHPAQAKVSIKATAYKTGQARVQIGTFRYAQAKTRIIAFDVSRFGQAQTYISRSFWTHGQARTQIKQTYPLFSIDTNYATAAYGATITASPDYTVEGAVENIIDSSAISYWESLVIFDVGAEDPYMYVTIDLGTNRPISAFSILASKYNATVEVQYNEYGWGNYWVTLDTVTFPVSVGEDLDPVANTVHRSFPTLNKRLWRLKITNGGDDSRIAINTWQLGSYSIKGATFAQALAQLGRFGHAQAGYYISPGLGTQIGQAKAQIVQTYRVSGQSYAFIIPPTYFGNAQASIIQVYQRYASTIAWILPPTAYAQALATIHAYDVNNIGQAIVSVLTQYSVEGQAEASIIKSAGYATTQVAIFRRTFIFSQSMVSVGHFQYGLAMAFIVAQYKYSQSLATVKQTYHKYSQAAVSIQRFERWGYALATILQTYRNPSNTGHAQAVINMGWGLGQALATVIQTYRKYATTTVWIEATYGQPAQALTSLFIEVWQLANANAHIAERHFGIGNATTQIGYFKYAQAQARMIAFNVPKVGNAGCYIKVDISIPNIIPSSDRASYLITFNGERIPGYVQSESFDSILNIVGYNNPYYDGSMRYPDYNYTQSFAAYNGLENKTITLTVIVWEPTYMECKARVQEAATILKSARGKYSKLYIQNYDKYYLAMPKSLTMEKEAYTSGQRLEYQLTFDAKPWLISNETYSILNAVGTTDTGARTIADGGWTPTKIIVSGTDIEISGMTDSLESTGTVNISGTVTDFIIDTEEFTSSDNSVITPKDYGIYVGPGRTTFHVTGATNCRIEWKNRWHL